MAIIFNLFVDIIINRDESLLVMAMITPPPLDSVPAMDISVTLKNIIVIEIKFEVKSIRSKNYISVMAKISYYVGHFDNILNKNMVLTLWLINFLNLQI